MPRWQIFGLGALGGLLPILVSLASADLSTFIDSHTLTLGNIIGYGIKSLVLILLGGTIAALNSGVTQPMSLVQLGIAAPALITSAINSPPPQPLKASAFFQIVNEAQAQERNDHLVIAGGFFSDVLKGIVQSPTAIHNDNIRQNFGDAVKEQLKPDQENGSKLLVTVFPNTLVVGEPTNSGTYCLTTSGLFGPGPTVPEKQPCVVNTEGNAFVGTTISKS